MSSARARPKLTGRAAVLVLVVSVLMVSYASSFRAYLEQRSQMNDLRARIATSNATIDQLQKEKRRWADPAYVKQMAREKFGYVMPDEVGYIVLDEKGKPLGHVDSLTDPASAKDAEPQWYQQAWDSVLLAGNPPAPAETPRPVQEIKPPKQKHDG